MGLRRCRRRWGSFPDARGPTPMREPDRGGGLSRPVRGSVGRQLDAPLAAGLLWRRWSGGAPFGVRHLVAVAKSSGRVDVGGQGGDRGEDLVLLTAHHSQVAPSQRQHVVLQLGVAAFDCGSAGVGTAPRGGPVEVLLPVALVEVGAHGDRRLRARLAFPTWWLDGWRGERSSHRGGATSAAQPWARFDALSATEVRCLWLGLTQEDVGRSPTAVSGIGYRSPGAVALRDLQVRAA